MIKFAVVIALSMAGSLIQAASLSKMWAWFLQSQYGAGPTYAAWFGISYIAFLLTFGLRSARSKDSEPSWSDLARSAIENIATVVICLPFAYATGKLFGWL